MVATGRFGCVLAWGLLVATASVGCFAPESFSLHPLFEGDELVVVPQLAGTWVAQKEDDDGEEPTVLKLEPPEAPLYTLTVMEDGKREPGELVVGLGRIGATLYWSPWRISARRASARAALTGSSWRWPSRSFSWRDRSNGGRALGRAAWFRCQARFAPGRGPDLSLPLRLHPDARPVQGRRSFSVLLALPLRPAPVLAGPRAPRRVGRPGASPAGAA